ncbi:CBS and ACT domain-containing protein [Salinithrix halophila]|uniref:CBS and ACT domain-containing protein n=1 Tax=Salinithrix halophila TaxID=1485204 RepID=A0ABV8JIF2_9BACL
MLVEQIMHRAVHTLPPELPIREAIQLAREHRVRHLPVVEDGRLIGLVSDQDLRAASLSELGPSEVWERSSQPVSTIMARRVISIHPLDFVEDAARLLYENRIGCLPVLRGNELVGILTETDILYRLVEIFGVHRPSQHFEVEVEDKIGILARVSRIFGDHRINIHSVLVERGDDPRQLKLVYRVQAKDLRGVVKSMKAAGYRVVWPHKEPRFREKGPR